MKCYLHRISKEVGWSNPLLKERNFLSIGWADFATSEYWLPDQNDISRIAESVAKCWQDYGWDVPRARFGLQRFLQMEKGDRVIVPTWGAFHVYEVADNECLVAADIEESVQNLKSWSGKCPFVKGGYLTEHDGQHKEQNKLDLGFFRRVTKVQRAIPRSGYADAALTSRMKVRQTNVEITDLQQSIDRAISAFKTQRPINLREIVLEKCAAKVREAIVTELTPNRFEKLIESYFKRQGADAMIPAKNERGKEGDADVVATFNTLNLIVNVQAKHHQGETNDWAVQQIDNYRDNKSEAMTGDEFTQVAWVISTAENFSENCKELARTEGVRLIDGNEFGKMLLDTGMEQLDHLMGG